MYTTVRELRGCRVRGIDRDAGAIDDVLIDDRSWSVRYVVADTGSWFHHHRVLLRPGVLGMLESADRAIHVSLNAADIERSPSVDADPPVAVLMERRLHDVVSLASTWVMGFGEPAVYPLAAPPPGVHYPAAVTSWTARPPHAGDMHLRSASHVLGHRVVATDGPVGSVEDFIIDDGSWRVTDLVVHLHGHPHRASVLVPARWVGDVSWGMRIVRINVPADRIDSSAAPRAGRRPPSVRSS